MNRIVIIFCVLSAMVLACGTASLPTEYPTAIPAKLSATSMPTLTPFVATSHDVVTLGKLNVRKCPSTQCEVLKVLDNGENVTVGIMIENNDWNCGRWYPINGGWICADWVSIKP